VATTGRQKAVAHIHRGTAFLQMAEKEPGRLPKPRLLFVRQWPPILNAWTANSMLAT
jgi:hypothetical protein